MVTLSPPNLTKMTINNSSLASEANYIYNLNIGDFYFYDNFFISEINEGEIIGKDAGLKFLDLINKHFGNNNPYGLISHRVYSYSTNLFELLQISNLFKFLVANAVVAYSDLALKNFELETRLFEFKGKSFISLEDAIEWTKKEVNNLIKN